jgi:hypothetical protein
MILFARLAITVWLFVLITKLHLENGFAVSESRTETVAEPRIETVSEPARRTSSLQAQEQREPLAQRTGAQKSAQSWTTMRACILFHTSQKCRHPFRQIAPFHYTTRVEFN